MKYLFAFVVVILLQACTTASKNPAVATESRDTAHTDLVMVFPEMSAMNDSILKAERDSVAIDSIAQIQNKFSAVDSLALVRKNFPFIVKYKFDAYKVPLFNGIPAAPDFRDNPNENDPEYVEFITEGCKIGINFGGHYTLIERSCGAMCSHLYMVDRRDGKIFIHTQGLKAEDGYYGFIYKKDSNLLITDATVVTDLFTGDGDGNQYSITPQVFEWKSNRFVLRD